jgi:hypothetical protein
MVAIIGWRETSPKGLGGISLSLEGWRPTFEGRVRRQYRPRRSGKLRSSARCVKGKVGLSGSGKIDIRSPLVVGAEVIVDETPVG